LLEIARKYLGIQTFESTGGRDILDIRNQSTRGIRVALEAAFQAGREYYVSPVLRKRKSPHGRKS